MVSILSANVKNFTFTYINIEAKLPLVCAVYKITYIILKLMLLIFSLYAIVHFGVVCVHGAHSTTSGKSFINATNRTGPRTESCGTPLVTLLQLPSLKDAVDTDSLSPIPQTSSDPA